MFISQLCSKLAWSKKIALYVVVVLPKLDNNNTNSTVHPRDDTTNDTMLIIYWKELVISACGFLKINIINKETEWETTLRLSHTATSIDNVISQLISLSIMLFISKSSDILKVLRMML